MWQCWWKVLKKSADRILLEAHSKLRLGVWIKVTTLDLQLCRLVAARTVRLRTKSSTNSGSARKSASTWLFLLHYLENRFSEIFRRVCPDKRLSHEVPVAFEKIDLAADGYHISTAKERRYNLSKRHLTRYTPKFVRNFQSESFRKYEIFAPFS